MQVGISGIYDDSRAILQETIATLQLITGNNRKVRPHFVKKISSEFYTEILYKKKRCKIVSDFNKIYTIDELS